MDPLLTGSKGAVRDATIGGEAHQGKVEGDGQPVVRQGDSAADMEGK